LGTDRIGNYFQIAKDIRVHDIVPTHFRAGFTDFNAGAPIIYLNTVLLDTTKRFVFAHELAHVILRMPQVSRLIYMQGRGDLLTDEEALADRIAAAILVPDSWIETLREGPYSPKRLRDVAQAANISVMRLVTRMASSGIDVALLHWRRKNDAWRVIDRPGVPPRLHGYIKPSSIGHGILDDLHREESNIVVDCQINGRRAKIAGWAYRQREHVFQFLEPSVDVWISPSIGYVLKQGN
jgi:IrrE N-terminal-like domain